MTAHIRANTDSRGMTFTYKVWLLCKYRSAAFREVTRPEIDTSNPAVSKATGNANAMPCWRLIAGLWPGENAGSAFFTT